VRKKSQRRNGSLQTEVPPPANDWVYACPRELATSDIAAALRVEGQPATEVSARTWQHDWQMANSLLDAYDRPHGWRWLPGEPGDNKLLGEWILGKSVETERTASGRIANERFVGELVVVRTSWESAENTLALLLDVVEERVNWSRKQYHPRARIVVVLEGWEHPFIAGKVGRRVAWSINQLPPTSSPQEARA
jgi:hypothetical protein